MTADMEERGVYRDTFNTLALLADLYFRNNSIEKLKATIVSMRRIKQKLNRDLGASECLRKIENLYQAEY